MAHLQPLSKDQTEFDAKDVMTSYTLDVIASAGLGIEANSFADREGIFRKRVRQYFHSKLKSQPFLNYIFLIGED